MPKGDRPGHRIVTDWSVSCEIPDNGEVTVNSQPDVARSRRRLSAPDRRRTIFAAAEKAFGDGAYHETSLDDVAEVAGISKALIYEHFSSKRELYQALLAESSDQLMLGVSTAVATAKEREGRLAAGIEAFFDFVAEHPGASSLLFHNATDPDVVSELDRLREEAATVIETLMADEVPPDRADDAIPVEVAVSMLSHQLIGSLQSLAVWWQRHPGTPKENVLRMAMEYGWLGLDRVSSGERWSV